MKLQRFYVENLILEIDKDFVLSEKGLFHQIKNVFRLRLGDKTVFVNQNGVEADCKILSVTNREIKFRPILIRKNENENEVKIVLYASVLKKDKFEWVVQKSTEIGVSRIVPLITRRTVKNNLVLERLEKIIKEAAEQAERGILPKIESPMIFSEALKDSQKNLVNFFFERSGIPVNEYKIEKKENTFGFFGVFVGPEGGWEKEEMKTIGQLKNFQSVSLGKMNLRAETAAVLATYIILNK